MMYYTHLYNFQSLISKSGCGAQTLRYENWFFLKWANFPTWIGKKVLENETRVEEIFGRLILNLRFGINPVFFNANYRPRRRKQKRSPAANEGSTLIHQKKRISNQILDRPGDNLEIHRSTPFRRKSHKINAILQHFYFTGKYYRHQLQSLPNRANTNSFRLRFAVLICKNFAFVYILRIFVLCWIRIRLLNWPINLSTRKSHQNRYQNFLEILDRQAADVEWCN